MDDQDKDKFVVEIHNGASYDGEVVNEVGGGLVNPKKIADEDEETSHEEVGVDEAHQDDDEDDLPKVEVQVNESNYGKEHLSNEVCLTLLQQKKLIDVFL